MSPVPDAATDKAAETRQALSLFLAAALVRALLAAATTLGAGEIRGDATDYAASALSFLSSGRLAGQGGMRAAHMPLYPLFLSAIFGLSGGPAVLAVQCVQVLLGAGTCVLIYRGARAILSPRAALFAGWAAALYFGLAYPCGRVLTECLYSFELALLFAVWLRWRPGGWSSASLAAAAVGLYLTRPEGLLAGAALAACGPWLKPGWRRRDSAWILAALLAACAAWSLRNRAAIGRPTPGTTNAGFTVWFALPRTLEKLDVRPEPPAPPFEDELGRDRFYWNAAREELSRASWPKLAKAAGYNLITLYYPFLPRYELTFVLFVPFWLASFFFLRGSRDLWPAAFLVGAWTILFIFVGGADSRFRQLFSPLLIWLSALGFQELERRISRRAWTPSLAGWASCNILIFLFADRIRGAVLALKYLKYGIH